MYGNIVNVGDEIGVKKKMGVPRNGKGHGSKHHWCFGPPWGLLIRRIACLVASFSSTEYKCKGIKLFLYTVKTLSFKFILLVCIFYDYVTIIVKCYRKFDDSF